MSGRDWSDVLDEIDRVKGLNAELLALAVRCKELLQHGDPDKDPRFSHLTDLEEIAEIMAQDCIRAVQTSELLYADLVATIAKAKGGI